MDLTMLLLSTMRLPGLLGSRMPACRCSHGSHGVVPQSFRKSVRCSQSPFKIRQGLFSISQDLFNVSQKLPSGNQTTAGQYSSLTINLGISNLFHTSQKLSHHNQAMG